MDVIIKKYDLKKGTEALHDKMEEELSDWTSENLDNRDSDDKQDEPISKKVKTPVDKMMVLNALKVLQGKVCVEDFPTVDSPAGSMAKTAFDIISRCIDHLITEENAAREDFHEPLLDFLLGLISSGPGTTHLDLIPRVFQDSNVDFREYFHTLEGTLLQKVLAVCRREYKTLEENTEDYSRLVTSNMWYIIDNGVTDEQCVANRAEFLDLYMYFQYGFQDRVEERDMMSTMADWIYRHLDSNPLQGITDRTVYVTFLNRLRELLLAEGFPQSRDDASRIEEGFKILFGGIRNAEIFNEVCDELMDCAVAIFDKKAGKLVHLLVEAFGDLFRDVKKKQLTGNGKMFESTCQKFVHIVETVKDHSLLGVSFVAGVVSNILVNTADRSPGHGVLLLNLISVLVRVPLKQTVRAADVAVRKNGKTIPWKEHSDAAMEIFDIVMLNMASTECKAVVKEYADFAVTFLNQIKKFRFHVVNGKIVCFVLDVLKSKKRKQRGLAREMTQSIEFDPKKDKSLIVDVFREIDSLLVDENHQWLSDTSDLVEDLAERAVESIKHGSSLEEADYKVVISIIQKALSNQHATPGTDDVPTSVYFTLYCKLTPPVLKMLDDIHHSDWALPILGGTIDLLTSDSELVRMLAGAQLMTVCGQSATLLVPLMDQLVSAFFNMESFQLSYVIMTVYPHNPGPVNDHFQQFMEYHDTADPTSKLYLLMLFKDVAKLHPELFTEDNLAVLLADAKADVNKATTIIPVLEEVAKKHPGKLGDLLPQLMEDGYVEYAKPLLMNVLKQIGVRSTKYAEPIMDYYARVLDGPEEQMLFLCVMDGMRNVGGAHVCLLVKHTALLRRVQDRTQIQDVKMGITGLIDIAEGRSLTTLSADIKDTQGEVQDLDVKVINAQEEVKVVSQEVDKQKEQLETVKTDMECQGKRVDDLEVTVDETVAKVEVIDGKTLSHAPFWSRDVSKLLNPKGDHDWRLLSTRLGYNNDDTRGWAQQHDPCMALLNEWYATRKTSEASYAVLTALQEMNRMDAASIVENAMKMAETVVEDEPFEYASPPAVFISYQWGIQNEVKLLKRHLEMAGYECWMDIGQMGGGDKLFEKIDQGIRGSKVIISCVTPKYAKSTNCNREVNLSVSMGRPILPLLMEKQTWPPAGSMGPIFSEYLFIRFFTRPGEETGDDRYWSAAKFQELLMQLNYNGIVPDEAKVMKEYKKWWVPVVEDIKIDKKKAGSKGEKSQTTETTEVAPVSPDVFISYQWGKQKQIMLLYRRLTSLGFSCWMDIHQMGGGDSLYDKIDRGVRGCKIILCCITTKYALSANCRREVSLADALKKPIVPLLLEKITWPPSGPMSMVFTQLLYINFSKDESVQEKWTGKEFDEMVGKIYDYVPAMISTDQCDDSSGAKCEFSDTVSDLKKKPLNDGDGHASNVNGHGNDEEKNKPETVDEMLNKTVSTMDSLVDHNDFIASPEGDSNKANTEVNTTPPTLSLESRSRSFPQRLRGIQRPKFLKSCTIL
ncbi:uncharacterized protein LOC124131311 [Haliotis rufescens]|uniref:uncharacterized protein LOC124131311 n=1 Tax=Haliotis rufescens TaxID=6454 RepID=UPI00201F0901|nr:uncharacterized protein LOC124131311 [Haliotis rufescens]